ncbi:DUF3298 and DUF4163 domain-containing protein [Pseudodesulfovibrio sp.]|uniref:DUF3298 and DUF4163 domain-containing protein n=1 Tax=Pseudodesulfovibrio sp. TaxID=2035812 RepID=UPI00262EB979|nr:DUF3298 and DUF4163 domain-containing protein [Pseudodesulfovibrio sp.]MDD3311998.1 DUF3298 domain-containing protein [Pseudodesulfovibrio sp.]
MRTRFAALPLLLLLTLLAGTASADAAFCTPGVLGEIREIETTRGFRVDAAYPVPCAPAAARQLRNHVARTVREFKETDPEHDLSFFPHPYELIVQYETTAAAGGRLLSVRLHTMVYTGGAHPNNWPDTWVFDLVDGRALTLDDLFPAPGGALRILATCVRAELRATLGEMLLEEMLQSGTDPTPDNYARFVLTERGLTFFFAPYQVAPYAAGEQRVTIPMDRLAPLLRPSLAAMLR